MFSKTTKATVLILTVLCGAFLTANNTYSFMVPNTLNGDDTGVISDVFGASNPLVLLVPGGNTDTDYDTQRKLVVYLSCLS